MESRSIRRTPRLGVELLEDRTVPALGFGQNIDALIDIAADYAKIRTERSLESASGKQEILERTGFDLTANVARVGLDVAQLGANIAALFNPVAAATTTIAQAVKVAKVGNSLNEIATKGLTPSTFAGLTADALGLIGNRYTDVVSSYISLNKSLSELGESAGRFGTALGNYTNPELVQPLTNFTKTAQEQVGAVTGALNGVMGAANNFVGEFGNTAVGANEQLVDFAIATGDGTAAAEVVENGQEIASAAVEMFNAGQAAAFEVQQALAEVGANATSETIAQFNDEILAIDMELAALPPGQREIATAQATGYTFALADGAAVQLNTTIDIIGGQQVANIAFVSQLNTIIVPLYFAGAEQVAVFSGIPGGGGGGGGGGGTTSGIAGTYTGTWNVNGNSGSMTLSVTGTSPNPNGNTALPRLNGSIRLDNFLGTTISGPLDALISTESGDLFGSGGTGGDTFTFADPARLSGGTASGNFVWQIFVNFIQFGTGTFSVQRN